MKLMSLSFCFTEHHVLIVLTACIIPPSDACTSVVEEAVVVDVYPAPFEPGVKSIQITEVNPLCNNLSEVVSNKRNLVNVTRKIHEISAFWSLEHGYAYCMVMESVTVILFRESFHHIHPVGSGIPMKLHVITGEISQEGQRPWHPVQYHLPHFHGGEPTALIRFFLLHVPNLFSLVSREYITVCCFLCLLYTMLLTVQHETCIVNRNQSPIITSTQSSILKRPKRLQPKHKLTKPPIHITRIRNQPQPRSVGPGRHEGGADGLGR